GVRRQHLHDVLLWREERDRSPPTTQEELETGVHQLLSVSLPRMLLSIVSSAFLPEVFSWRRVVNDLVAVEGWNRSGRTVLCTAPYGLMYLFHHLQGAFCIEQNNIRHAVECALSQIPRASRDGTQRLLDASDALGWPEFLGGTCTVGWRFLLKLPESHSVLNRIFAFRRDYEYALAAYNALLSLLEFACDLEKLEGVEPSNIHLGVPPTYILASREVRDAVILDVIRNRDVVSLVAMTVGADHDRMRKLWSVWALVTKRFATNVSQHRIWKGDVELGGLG
ncbi:MAG: hypothetical protein AAF411_26925, partial [Myxococcota bacterium]